VLLALRNLLKTAHDREQRGEPPPAPKVPDSRGRKSADAPRAPARG